MDDHHLIYLGILAVIAYVAYIACWTCQGKDPADGVLISGLVGFLGLLSGIKITKLGKA